MTNDVPRPFEEKLERIDAIVKDLETGRIELDKAIELFKEGKALTRECEALLRNAQEQVDAATSDASPS
ncbi:MAG: exodeoxyribonuclease VII small subunit [Candidatus Eremiobacteraeota bacterium]|nr:exodeoxyribonuclease VII small subunit [Candidatus Eremiobacteraeota bacterium]